MNEREDASSDESQRPRACPIDGVPLVEQELARGVPVPICAKCSVHWFKRSKLRRFALERRRELRLDPQLKGVAREPGAPALACPECGTLSLTAHRYRDERLHSCTRCHGLLVPAELLPWLDRPSVPHDPVDAREDGFPRGRNWLTRLLWRAARLVLDLAADLVGK